jgi:hypothetical protein
LPSVRLAAEGAARQWGRIPVIRDSRSNKAENAGSVGRTRVVLCRSSKVRHNGIPQKRDMVDVTHLDIATTAAQVYAMDERPSAPGEKPSVEPEIIPPGGDDWQSRSSRARIRVFVDESGIRHIQVPRLWLLGIFLLALTIGIVFAILLVLVLGAFLIWIPLAGLLVAAAIISGLLRAFFRRPR